MAIVVKRPQRAGQADAWVLWQRWVIANTVGEILGFGLAVTLAMAAVGLIEPLTGIAQGMAMVGAVVVVGVVEGSAVGLVQWLALRRELSQIGRREWLSATVAGAIVAWAVGVTVGKLVGDQLEALAGGSQILSALTIGVAAGTLLSLFQWPVLRKAVPHAFWWVPAHAGAWAIGMAVSFTGIGTIPEDASVPVVAAVGVVTGLAMGLAVAALTGLALVMLVRSDRAR